MNLRQPHYIKRGGVALVMVLGALVLISAIALAYLGSVSTELKSTKYFADGSNVRMLSDTAVNLVIGQIREATRGRDVSGHAVAWASQPGMIRLYDDAGKPAGHYKLYSSIGMTGSGAFKPDTDDPVPATWTDDSALFTDLNEPVLDVASRQKLYPIVNPDAVAAGVEGFKIESAPGAVASGNPAPMPVRWLYVFQNGQILAPTGGGDRRATFDPAVATDDNPVVARLAFWTDDETCKVNVNTAAEGTYWDTPRAFSSYEVAYGLNQPALREFQRYPGHPATTALSSVLGWKLPVTEGVEPLPYYTLAPRVNEGGSRAGSVPVGSAAKINLDKDRLYASIDEMEFRPDRSDLGDASLSLSAPDLEKTRFFLTASSRAPDVNLFNRPRVGIWPISALDDKDHRTLFDQAIAFCGTIGGQAYYFQRQDPNSPTADLALGRNPALRTYLKALTAAEIPGFGGSFAAKYGADRNQILTQIFDYVRCTNLCDSNGGASGFVSYTPRTVVTGSGKAQVVPIHDAADDTRGFGRFPTLSEAAFLFIAVPEETNPAVPYLGAMRLQPAILPELFDPSLGFPTTIGKFSIRVSGLSNFKWSDNSPMFFNDTAKVDFKRKVIAANPDAVQNLTRHFGGGWGTRLALMSTSNGGTSASLVGTKSPVVPNPKMPENANATFAFSGGEVTVEFVSPNGDVAQSLKLKFPAANIKIPEVVPKTGGESPTPTIYPTIGGSTGIATFLDIAARFKGEAGGRASCWITEFDAVRGLPARSGDYRLVASRFKVEDSGGPNDQFAELPNYASTDLMSHCLIEATGHAFYGSKRGWLLQNALYLRSTVDNPTVHNTVMKKGLDFLTMNQDLRQNGVALGKSTDFASGDLPGDWDNGFGDVQDGPYINRADEGAIDSAVSGATDGTQNGSYYYPRNTAPAVDTGGTFFSPNRQIPSPVVFGSLPSGSKANRPWQTLLFRPDPSGKHPGSRDRKVDGASSTGQPSDHLWLDLFHMPIVEPYPISEPFSTAGRINMNYQLVPFTYLKRDTGIRAVLKHEKLLCLPNLGTVDNINKGTTAVDYKRRTDDTAAPTNWRKNLDIDQTLTGFTNRFDSGEIFRSATEICELPLIPEGASFAEVSNATTDFWQKNYPLTGDNSRERPYANIYPRLTTKSNSYTVHCRVQTLQRSRLRQRNAPAEFDQAKGDAVTGEFRGATLIERFIDPNDPALPDFASAAISDPAGDIDAHYRFRVVSVKKFAP